MRIRLFLVVALSLSVAALTSFAQETPSDSTARGGITPAPTTPYPSPTPNSPTDQVGSSATSPNFDSFQNLNDADVLGVVCAIDGNEIAAAQFVQDSHHGKTSATMDKSSGNRVGDPVEDFAEMLRKDHEKNLKDAKALAKKMNLTVSTTNEPIQMLKTKGTQDLAMLKTMTGTQLERTYINAMIQGHQEALRIIDTMMPPTTMSASTGAPPATTTTSKNSQQVRDFLTQTRMAVAQHLAKAQEIESQLSLR